VQQRLDPAEFEDMVMKKYPFIDEEGWCAQSRFFRNKARESYRHKLAELYRQQQNEPATTTAIQRDQHTQA
jgi:hypothetical protein